MSNSFSWKKAERLRKKVDFQRIYSQGKRFEEDSFCLYVLKRSPGPLSREEISNVRGWTDARDKRNRIGFVVGKRVDKKAVTRNRLKRLLREAYRLNKGKLKERRDLALVAKKGAGELSFREGQEALLQLFRKAGLIKITLPAVGSEQCQ